MREVPTTSSQSHSSKSSYSLINFFTPWRRRNVSEEAKPLLRTETPRTDYKTSALDDEAPSKPLIQRGIALLWEEIQNEIEQQKSSNGAQTLPQHELDQCITRVLESPIKPWLKQ